MTKPENRKWWNKAKPNSPQNHVKWLISWGILKRSTIIWSHLQARIIFPHLSKNDSIFATFLLYFTKYCKFWNSKVLAIEKCKKILENFRISSERPWVYFQSERRNTLTYIINDKSVTKLNPAYLSTFDYNLFN